MVLYSLLALMNLFPIAFIIKGNANNGRNPLSCPFPALATPFPDIAFINEETTGCINKEAIGAIIEASIGYIMARRNPHY